MARNMITSDAAIRSIKPGDGRKRISDGGGLYLLLFVKGGAHGWRLDYTLGTRKTISLGTYPDTGLKLAREKAATARTLVAAGIDPSGQRKAEKEHRATAREDAAREQSGIPARGSFEEVGREWFATRRDRWSPIYGDKVIRRLEVDVFPWIGRKPVQSITPPQVLEVLQRIESRGVIETAHRALESCGQVFRYAIATGKAESNPARDLKDVLRKPVVKHFAAITNPVRLGEFLRACESYKGTHIVRGALRLLPLVLLRPGEMRHAQWDEFDLDAAVWTVPAARMKREKAGKQNGKPHIVPLATQAVAALRDLYQLTGPDGHVFKGERYRKRPMSDATLAKAFRAMGFGRDEVSAHGFRATARTMLAERLGVTESVIEAQLAHVVRDALGRAYNRTEFQAERNAMMQRWADYLDKLCAGADVIALHGTAA